MGFFKRLLQHLFRRKKKIDRAKTTKKFQEFREYQIGEDQRTGLENSPNKLLTIYICKYKVSPWIEDDYPFKEARKFLIEMGVKEKIL